MVGRLLELMTNQMNLDTIAALARKDPMTGEPAELLAGGPGQHQRASAAAAPVGVGACEPPAQALAVSARHACCWGALPHGLAPLTSPGCAPPAGPNDSWAPPEVRVAVPLGATLLSLLFFGQTVRLAIHVGFNCRVHAVSGGKGVGGAGRGE